MTAPFDFAPLLAPGTPAPAVKWNGFPKYNFIGGHNDAKHVPVDALIAAATSVLRREGASLATYGLNSGPLGYRPLREFLAGKLKGHAGIDCSPDEILITSGSMQGLDLINSLLLAKGDTVLIEQETYAGALTKLTRLGINTIGIPLDAEGLRLDALKEKLEELKKKGVKPKYIYTIPTVQNPTGAIMGEARRAELLKIAADYGVMIFEDECYSDLIWDGKRPRSLYAMADGEGVIHIGSFSKSIAPALRVGYIVAKWEVLARILALKQDAGSGALEQMVLAEFCKQHFAEHVPKLSQDAGRQAADPARGAGRAVRHRRGVRRPGGRHLSLDQAARQCRYGEARAGSARRRRVAQSRAGMVDQQGVCPLPAAPLLRQSRTGDHQAGRRRAGRGLPPRVRRAAAQRQCGEGLTERSRFRRPGCGLPL